MTRFAYNKAKNTRTDYTLFELNCGYHPCIIYKENINLFFKSKTANKQVSEFLEMMTVCKKNFYYAQKLQKQPYNMSVKLQSYVLGNKVWLNSKYIKVKQNQKLDIKFFSPF